jgi:hypothetical protein
MSLVYKLLAILLAGALFASESFAAPRAQSAEECGIAADMALVAQSLAREDIHRPKAGAIIELFVACMKTGGDMDAILGRRL